MSTKTVASYTSGHCGIGHHAVCRGEYAFVQCKCPCGHTAVVEPDETGRRVAELAQAMAYADSDAYGSDDLPARYQHLADLAIARVDAHWLTVVSTR